MTLVCATSLAATVDRIDGVLFDRGEIGRSEARDAARWIAARQGLPGCYADMFAPMPRDRAGVRLFTGERIVTRAGSTHMLGEEACRVLRLLDVRDVAVASALERANTGMLVMLHRHAGAERGEYCCGPCSVAVWRHLAVGGLDAQEARLADGMRRLAQHRLDDGTWRRFPFYYTLLALVGIDGDLPLTELRHAAPRCERLLRRSPGRVTVERRRRLLMERVLERVS